MNRMNGNENSDAGRRFFRLASRHIDAEKQMRQTPEAKQVEKSRNTLAESVLNAIDSAEAVEDLIHYEMVLQRVDELSAQSPQDKASIKNAQRQYWQLSETVAQMRRNPYEYFRANMALGGTDGGFWKIPRVRIQHINSNVTRLRNRASFALEEERNFWNVRLKLAEKTKEMLRTLHKSLAEEYEPKLTDWETFQRLSSK